MEIHGTFDIKMSAEPPFDVVDGVSLGRVTFEKRFHGPLEAESRVWFIGARTPVEGSAGYAAIERVTGSLEGRRGSFVLQHSGTMTRGKTSLSVTVVPDSGTGDLAGLRGSMAIQVEAGVHHYRFEYALEG